MTNKYELTTKGFKEFKKALERNPTKISRASGVLIQRAIAKYREGIQNNPWRIGMSGGGAPVLTGFLKDTHESKVSPFEGSIFPTAKYGKYLHPKRPWLDYVFKQKMPEIKQLEDDFLKEIITDLAK
jgi:hypothetical protein